MVTGLLGVNDTKRGARVGDEANRLRRMMTGEAQGPALPPCWVDLGRHGIGWGMSRGCGDLLFIWLPCGQGLDGRGLRRVGAGYRSQTEGLRFSYLKPA